ncbi:MAG: hypothetical protein K8R73_07250 [Clostridiales bacterium]|nr:hypothetical protein [Clostridiales bacterium]
MNLKILIPILTIFLPLLGALVGYIIRHNLDKKKELASEINKERRELYQQFVNLIIDIFSSIKTGEQFVDKDLINKLFGFYKKYVLFASPGVINAYSDYFQFLYAAQGNSENVEPKKHIYTLSKIMYEMRKDLGLKNRKLGDNGINLFRAMLTDFDKMMK